MIPEPTEGFTVEFTSTAGPRQRHRFEPRSDGARQFADAAGYANHLDRDTLVLISICHAQQLQLGELKEGVDDLEAQLDEE